jgi:hypothetical protein
MSRTEIANRTQKYKLKEKGIPLLATLALKALGLLKAGKSSRQQVSLHSFVQRHARQIYSCEHVMQQRAPESTRLTCEVHVGAAG